MERTDLTSLIVRPGTDKDGFLFISFLSATTDHGVTVTTHFNQPRYTHVTFHVSRHVAVNLAQGTFKPQFFYLS